MNSSVVQTFEVLKIIFSEANYKLLIGNFLILFGVFIIIFYSFQPQQPEDVNEEKSTTVTDSATKKSGNNDMNTL